MLDPNNPLVHSFLVVQVVGFPAVFLLRAGVRFWRTFRGEARLRERNLLEGIANVCFGSTSIAFAFCIPVAVALFAAGVILSFRAFKSASFADPAARRS
jgi:hypothetical protein